jgi:hypothetical protein
MKEILASNNYIHNQMLQVIQEWYEESWK